MANFTDHPELGHGRPGARRRMRPTSSRSAATPGRHRAAPLPIVVGPDRRRVRACRPGRGDPPDPGRLHRCRGRSPSLDLPEAERVAGGRPGPALAARGRATGAESRGRMDRLGRRDAPLARRRASTDPPDVTLAPGPPPVVDEADGAAAYAAWRAGMARGRVGQRAVRPAHRAQRRRPAAPAQRRSRRRANAISPPACPGSPRCSAATRSSRAYESIAFRPDLAVATLEVLAARQARGRRPVDRRRAGQDPARDPDRRDGPDRRAAVRDVLRQRRLDARSG